MEVSGMHMFQYVAKRIDGVGYFAGVMCLALV